MGNRIAVVTIAVEFKNGHNYTDAINEIGQKKNKFSLPPIDIKRTERFHVFDGLGFDSGIKATLNLFLKTTVMVGVLQYIFLISNMSWRI